MRSESDARVRFRRKCASGGPVLVLERGGTRLRQIAVTSAADAQCREFAIFALVDEQHAELREMFDTLMEGEQGAEQNPF